MPTRWGLRKITPDQPVKPPLDGPPQPVLLAPALLNGSLMRPPRSIPSALEPATPLCLYAINEPTLIIFLLEPRSC